MKLDTHNKNAEFYLASLALGILEGIKQGVVSPEAGVWSLARPSFSSEVLKSTMISDELKDVIGCFDEIDAWSCFESGKVKQQEMIDQLKDKCLRCLEIVDYKNIDMTMSSSMNSGQDLCNEA